MTGGRLPVTVVSGYLGAGKTTLINRLLAEDHGRKLMVMVNDFGAINIDAALLESAGRDTIALTNGCVCCTMGADLFMALGDALDRRPRPDHLVIEASGIADPARIANAALAEPEMLCAGVITMVDAEMFPVLSTDPMIGPQYLQQIRCADVVVLRGPATHAIDRVREDLKALGPALVLDRKIPDRIAPLLLDRDTPAGWRYGPSDRHPDYLQWHTTGGGPADRVALDRLLAARPAGVLRMKGFVCSADGACWTVQSVGPRLSVTSADEAKETRLVALGLRSVLTASEIDRWWGRTGPR